jgi:sugar phosphate isomerase/epimerase
MTTADRFARARELHADGVELRFGPHDFEQHSLWQPEGPHALRTQARDADVVLPSVFAGYFHAFPLGAAEAAARRQHAQVLDRLLDACSAAEVPVIVLPLLGAGEVTSEPVPPAFVETLTPLAHKAAACNLTLALETTWPAAAVLALLARVGSPAVRVAYDVGNAAVLGFDAIADFQLLGDALGQVRVRDCTPGGRRASLGQGAVALPALAQALAQRSYQGWWVLEAAAGDERATRAEVEFLRRLRA